MSINEELNNKISGNSTQGLQGPSLSNVVFPIALKKRQHSARGVREVLDTSFNDFEPNNKDRDIESYSFPNVGFTTSIMGYPVSVAPTYSPSAGFGLEAKATFANGGAVDYSDFEDAFGPVSEFGTDTSEETKEANRYSPEDDASGERSGDMYSLNPEQFTAMRGATKRNPFPDSLPSRIARFFGTDVDYTQQYGGGDAGLQRVAEINALRQAQSLYPEDFTRKDFYEGQPTVRGPAVDVSNPITQGIRMLAPYGSGQIIPGDFLPQEIARERGLTAQQQKLIDLGMFRRFFGR